MAPPTEMGGGRLAALLKQERQRLIDRWTTETGRANTATALSRAELLDHVPQFVDELIAALFPGALPLPPDGGNALEHGAQRFRLGFDVSEVVREYGTLHRCIIELADREHVPIESHEHLVLAHLLNAGIASALSEYVSGRDAELQRQASEHLGFIAHEIRNPLASVTVAVQLLRRGPLAEGGPEVAVLERNLRRTNEVIENALHHASLAMGISLRRDLVPLAAFLAELELDWGVEAKAKGITLAVAAPAGLTVHADARVLRSAIANLIQNALKFSRPTTTVHLRAQRDGSQVLVDVEDACGGLPPGKAEDLFEPLVRRANDEAGFGLGLAIARQAAQAHQGMLTVRDLPGRGCIFTLHLPAG
jgi:signal transduction histidine kinase